jgi:hypothetical protein
VNVYLAVPQLEGGSKWGENEFGDEGTYGDKQGTFPEEEND